MGKYFLYSTVFSLAAKFGFSQVQLTPNRNFFETKFIKNTKYEMACFLITPQGNIEVSSLAIQVNSNEKSLSIYTKLHIYNTNEEWKDTSIADATTFSPLYRSSCNPNSEFSLKFNKDISGFYFDKKTKDKKTVNESVKENFFESYIYPYLLGALPLAPGYKADIPVYEYKPDNTSNIKKTRIEGVKSNMYISDITGEHKVWQVSILEATNARYEYYIDKGNRKIYKIEIFAANGQRFILFNKEIDYNPFTATFDKSETLKLVKDGTAAIEGVAFARDNENEGVFKGMAIFNINKKQYAKMGTTVILIPYTSYFKEWKSINENLRKKGRAVPLSKEATECIKTTTVYDNNGHFEFTNLMPGDYMLYTEFDYNHTNIRTEVVGYTDTYINGIFHGSAANTEMRHYGSNAVAGINKIITIKKAGEKLEIKLKKTL